MLHQLLGFGKMNYYQILNISNTASQEQVKKAYLDKAKECHADHGGNDEQFKIVCEAYETLKDEEKRRNYDKSIPSFHFFSTQHSHFPKKEKGKIRVK